MSSFWVDVLLLLLGEEDFLPLSQENIVVVGPVVLGVRVKVEWV